MKRRTFAFVLACALSLSLLSACGGGGGSSSSQGGSSAGGSSSVEDSSSASGSGSDQSAGGSASLPDESGSASTSEGGSTSSGSASQGGSSGTAEGGSSQADQLTLNRTDFTLFSAGSTFQLKYQAPAGAQGEAAFASSDEAVATVAQDGTITAVAPGQATVTLTYGDLTASCTVRCRWEDAPADTGDSSTGGTGDISQGGTEEPTEPETPAAENVDLQSFFDTINTAYEMPFMMAVDSTGLDSFYAGLTGISTQQLVVYQCGMSPASAGDVALVQVSDSADVEAVKAIFQARIDYMTGADGGMPGAWYPGPTEMWLNSSRIVSNGNYVMLVVNESCDAIVNDFNALF